MGEVTLRVNAVEPQVRLAICAILEGGVSAERQALPAPCSRSGRHGNERRESVKSPVQRRLRAPMSLAAGALRSSTVQQCVIPDT